jgi:hypothetical protein
MAAQAKVQAETALQLSLDGLAMAGIAGGHVHLDTSPSSPSSPSSPAALEALRVALIAAVRSGADSALVWP